jgi:glyoxylase-like metal-dependent hydrolase (beta-lactamase superfamily II)
MQIHTLDLNFRSTPNTIASYLVIGSDGPILVETGPGSTLETLKTRIFEHGFSPSDIKYVLVTHIHLDHAGAAGWWAQQGAQIFVHHIGAPHLVNPAKLLASAGRIYGELMDPLWGPMVPAPEERVTSVFDGDTINVAGLSFTAIDTPGHAYHHHVFKVADVAFTGDAAGIHIPGPSFVDLPAPPPEFNLELWQGSVERLCELDVTAIYPTHFGRVEDWRGHLETFSKLLDASSEFVRLRLESGMERDGIVEDYLTWQRERVGSAQLSDILVKRYEVSNPLYMSVDGIIRYWRKRLPETRPGNTGQ